MKYCRYCGAELEDDAVFCDKCGKKLTDGGQHSNYKKESNVVDGKIFKCPFCGGNLPSNASACPHCGSEIRGREAVTSVKDFFDSLKNIDSDSKKMDLIKTYPIPNNKEDIVEFMLMASSNFDAQHYVRDRDNDSINSAWLVKIEQSYNKGKLLFVAQSDITPIENIYQSIQKKIKDSKKQLFFKTNFRKFIPAICVTVSILAIAIPVTAWCTYIPKPKEGQTIFVGYGADHFKDENYKDVESYFINKGFVDVNLNPLKDLVTGWINKKDTVTTVSINGDTSFHWNRWYYPTDKVIISYHSFK